MSSIAERLIQEGMEKGLEEGLKEGLKQGRRDALRAILARQLRARFGALSPDLERQLAEATENRLDRWIDRVLTATSPEDLLGA